MQITTAAIRLVGAAVLGIAAAGASGRAGAENRWPDERIAGPFVCHADFSLEPYSGLLLELTRLQEDLVRELAVARTREPVHAYLFARNATYKSYVGKWFPNAPSRPALFIKDRGPGMLFAVEGDNLAIDLRHEGVHALLHGVLPMVPLWLDEGLAEYFEVAPEERPHGNPHLRSLQRSLWIKGAPRLDRLEQLERLEDMGAGHYRDAWAWVHFMLHGPPEAREELIRFLQDVAALSPPGNLSDRLRRRMPDLEQRFVRHFQEWRR